MQGCEVMIKDLQDSKRIDHRVHERSKVRLLVASQVSSNSPSQIPVHATIVSRLFWPSFQPSPLKLPGQLGRFVSPSSLQSRLSLNGARNRAQAEYEESFVHLKPDKKLRWLPHLGTVNITIDLKDRSLTLDATPVQASIIELFGTQGTWTFCTAASRG